MKNILITILIIINIGVMIGLFGLVIYQFQQILDRNTQIEKLKNQVLQSRSAKLVNQNEVNFSTSSSISTNKVDEQSLILDSLQKKSNGEYAVKIFLPKSGDNDIEVSKVYPTQRSSDQKDVVNYVISEIVKGPNPSELALNFVAPIKFSGSSNCGVVDFTSYVNDGNVFIKFCRAVLTAGAGDEAKIKLSIENTLKQFPIIKKIEILNNNNTCFADLSGLDQCKILNNK
jgi:hypothetical protein